LNNEESRLKLRLKNAGLSKDAINAAWPIWWSQAAEASPSACAELRFSLARKLGLDPRSLLDDDEEPKFVWRTEARFKHLSGESDREKAAITSFGKAIAAALLNATPPGYSGEPARALGLRRLILKDQPYVRLIDLLGVCWSLGIPVIHLRVFPCVQKRMAAMSVRVGDRQAILLAKDSMYPAPISFYVAHELGHILSGHLQQDAAVVDFDSSELASGEEDPEETEADTFALELLTGEARPKVLSKSGAYSGKELARVANDASTSLKIEPGVLALCFGYSTQQWETTNAAMKRIYTSAKPVWSEINKAALQQLDLERVPDDTKFYIKAVLGAP
jgi:Zn-dependent peptidase ImmA (M78 family)